MARRWWTLATVCLGILMLLLLTGMETDLGLVKKVRRAAFSVSLAGIAVPFACRTWAICKSTASNVSLMTA